MHLAFKPAAISSVDLGFLFFVAKETFMEGVCSTHPHAKSPCNCGEPLNSELQVLLKKDELVFGSTSKKFSTKSKLLQFTWLLSSPVLPFANPYRRMVYIS